MRRLIVLVCGLCCAALAGHVSASIIAPGDLIVVQSGDGSAALGVNATAAFLNEYTTTGTAVQSVGLPIAVSGGNKPLTLSGSVTSVGFIALSTDGKYLTLGGYAAVPGTAVTSVSASTVNRVIGRVDVNANLTTANINTTTSLTDAYNGVSTGTTADIRSVVSTNGTDFWTSGAVASTAGGNIPTNGVRYATLGATTSTQVAVNNNNRVANIANSQLYVSSGANSLLGPTTVGSGTPMTTGQTLSLLNGFPTTGTHSPYDFWFLNTTTLYVADDGSAVSGGGIQKWTLSAGTWSLQYTLLNSTADPNAAISAGVRGLAGTIDGLGEAVLYATNSTSLYSVTDKGTLALLSASNATALLLATAPALTAFRGVELIPSAVPEISSFVMVGLIGAGAFAVRRTRRGKVSAA
jgi:hypothetical protein